MPIVNIIEEHELQNAYIGSTPAKRIMMRPNGVEKKVRPTGAVLFDYGDWTDSVWTAGPDSGVSMGTVTKTSSYITFYSNSHSMAYLSDYLIDGTKDFLLEFNANVPSTSSSYNRLGLVNSQCTTRITIMTNWEYNAKIIFEVNGTRTNSGENNPGTTDYFIKKEGGVLTMGWGGVTKYTNSSLTFDTEYYFQEKVYRDTLTINTAKLTYL